MKSSMPEIYGNKGFRKWRKFIMTKVELIAKIAEDTGLTKKDAEKALNSTLKNITSALAEQDRVMLVGFGTFECRKRAARVCRDPRTGEEISVAATTVPAFKAGQALKDAVVEK